MAKPYVYITGHEYLWPDSTLFSLAEIYYDFTTRVNRGDMSSAEANKFFLKFSIFRANLLIENIDFQSIMFGDAWSNPLVFIFDGYKKLIKLDGCYLDLDGCLAEAYSVIAFQMTNCHVNLTNYEYGLWLDYTYDCYAYGEDDSPAYLIVENTLFTGHH